MTQLVIALQNVNPSINQAAIDEYKEIVVLVPGEDVLLTKAVLPNLSKNKLLQALPFALEEQLIADVEQLHFVPLMKDQEETVIAVIAKEKMQSWLNQLSNSQIKPDYFLPDYFALNFKENTWQVAIYKNIALVRTGLAAGFNCDRTNLGEYLQIEIAKMDEPPKEIIIHNYTLQPVSYLNLTVPIQETQFAESQFMSDITQALKPPFNLLQGHFSQKKSRRSGLKYLHLLLPFLLSLWVLTITSYPIISYFILNEKMHSLNEQIAMIYKRNFPAATSIVAPKLRMEEKLRGLNGQMLDNQFLPLLAKLAEGLKSFPDIELKRADYQNKQVSIQVTANNSEQITSFIKGLISNGLNVKQQNATLENSIASATLLVSL